MEETYDKEFYFVTFEDFSGRVESVNVHLRHGETIWNYMRRIYSIPIENIHCIYKRIFVKQ